MLGKKKHLAAAVLITLFLTVTLFMILPSRSQVASPQYDPWVDLNDDGTIDILDIAMLAVNFGTSGNPIDKIALLQELQSEVQALQAKVEALEQNGTTLSEIYDNARDSVVMIQGTTVNGTIQASGFVYNYSGTIVVLTNNHVVSGTSEISVTFSNGNGYAATVKGTDPYADFAVLTVNAPESEFKPLEIVDSSILKVGNIVVTVGNPFGLVSTMTTGTVSALGRTITEEFAGGFMIANIIQTDTAINPGNSGGPLLNYLGKVVGITTAIVSGSQGLGFAIPSNTMLREIPALIINGTYQDHPYLGVNGADMDYATAQDLGISITYGWRVASVVSGGPAANAGVRSGDIIIGINGTRIANGDQMSSYLEANTLPGETITLSIFRNNQTLQIPLILGRRPPPP
ncbi:MAG TPA: trypsin-like peptidase domain-containing protein [Candidatus Bathyarchaeia archaeon]